MSSSFALQAAVFNRLSTATALTALLGGPRVYDRAPVGAPFPYVTFGQSTTRDWSTGTDRGDEHVLSLHVWGQGDARKSVEQIAEVIRGLLHQQPLTLTGHRLINLTRDFSETRRETDGDIVHALVRFRAVTEVI
jgi:Protein of unknown function (DUF3168)